MTDHAPGLERIFALDVEEGDYEIDRIDGAIPTYLDGIYYVNGPARFARGDVDYKHWLDGDGMVCALRLKNGQAHFTNRFVRSTKLTDEDEAGRARYRTFGTSFPGDELVRGIALASPVNVSVYPFAGTLLAFGEQGLPWELHPETLETRGEYTFGGRLNAISPFSAHPHIDPVTGELFNFGVSFSARQPMINLYRFDAEGALVYRKRLPIDHPSSIHDFGLSARHVVIYDNPYVLDMASLMDTGNTLMDVLHWRPELGTVLRLADRETGESRGTVTIEPRYCLHLVNCFDQGDHLVVDVIEMDEPVYDQYDVPELFPDVRTSEPVRYVIDPATCTVVDRRTLDYQLMCDFPAVDPRLASRSYRDFWVLGISKTLHVGRKFFDQVVHLDWHTGTASHWQAPKGVYLGGEPVFLPDPTDERRGAVLCQAFDAATNQASLLLFDGHHLTDGPIATLHLRHPITLGFHACYEMTHHDA